MPVDAVSGVYIAHLVRNDTGGESQILFVVRKDSSHSDIVVQTSDTTWEAYNTYGGNSLYTCTVACPPGNPHGYKAAYKVSYNRPFDGSFDRDGGCSDPFYAEFPMIRFLEAKRLRHELRLRRDVDDNPGRCFSTTRSSCLAATTSTGPGPTRNVEAARNAGVSLAFFSGNEMFWKTRWGPAPKARTRPIGP